MFADASDTSVSQSWVEHQALEHIKRALRVTIDWRTPAITSERKRSSVSFAMDCFARHMERLMAIEEEDGYMRHVAEVKPHNAKRVAKLQGDHARFRTQLAEFTRQLSDLSEWQSVDFDQLCDDIRQLLDDIDQHDTDEIRLLQESMLQDEGVGD